MSSSLRIATRSFGVVQPTYPDTSVCTTALYMQSASSGQVEQDDRALVTNRSYSCQVCLGAVDLTGGSSSSGCRYSPMSVAHGVAVNPSSGDVAPEARSVI